MAASAETGAEIEVARAGDALAVRTTSGDHDRINLDAPVIATRADGSSCEFPTPGGYAAEITLTGDIESLKVISVPTCDERIGFCTYIDVGLSALGR